MFVKAEHAPELSHWLWTHSGDFGGLGANRDTLTLEPDPCGTRRACARTEAWNQCSVNYAGKWQLKG